MEYQRTSKNKGENMDNNINILLVDDEPSLLTQAKIFLEREKEEINIITALSAEKALDLFDDDIDVIVSDYQMPVMNGLEFLEEVRKKREIDIPFIMFTGKGREEVAMKALNLGADRYIQKGGDPKSQFNVLAQAISQEFLHYQVEKKFELTKNSVDKANTGIFWIDPDGKFVYTNQKVEEILGYSEAELRNMYVWEIDAEHEEDKEIRKKHWERLKKKKSEMIERKHETRDGEVFPVEVFRNYIKHGDEELEFAFARDIKERKNKEKELRDERNFIEQIAETSPVCITKVDKDGDILWANEKAEEVLGLSKSEIEGRTYDDPKWKITDFEGEEYPVEELPFKMVKEKGEAVYDVRHAIEWPDGERRQLSINAAPLYDQEGEFDGMVATIEDVTEEVEKEKELKESEERYRRLFETAHDGMLIIDAKSGKIKDANPHLQDMIGFSKEELVGKELWEIGTFRDLYENKKRFKELVDEGKIRYEDLPLETREGEEIPVEFLSNTYEVGEEKVVQCNIREITERKEMEEKLREQKRNYQELFEKSADALFVFDPDTAEILDVNRKTCEMYGYSREEALDLTIGDLVSDHPTYTEEEAKRRVRKARKEGPITFEWLDEKKDGTQIWIEVTLKVARIGGEEVVLASERDITERKKMERELQESREKYLSLFEQSMDAIYLHDRKGNILEVNERACEQSGYDRQELLKMNVFDLYIDDPDSKNLPKEEVLSDWQEWEVGARHTIEGEHQHKDGTIYSVKIVAGVVEYGDEELIMGVVKDITEQKEAEKKIKEVKERLDLALKGTKAGIWDWYVQTGETVFNERWAEMLGYELEELEPTTIKTWRELAHPEDLERSEDLLEKHFVGETDMYEFEGRMKHKDGHWIWIFDRGKVVEWDDDGNPIRMTGSHIDITERKKAEERREFLYSLLHHDVGNKIQVAKGYVHLMKDENEDYSDELMRNIKSTEDLIDKIRTLQEVEKSEEVGEVELNNLMDQVIRDYEEQAKGKDIALEVQDFNSKVKGGLLLKPAFGNLIENSMIHSLCKKIKIGGEAKGEDVVVTVEDDGKGLSDDVKEKIFERGYKKGENAGSGLGTYLVKEIVESYGGIVEVKDSELGGARFDVKLKRT